MPIHYKYLIGSIAACICYVHCYTQNYVPLVVEGNTWFEEYEYMSAYGDLTSFLIDQDTIIDDMQYWRLRKWVQHSSAGWMGQVEINPVYEDTIPIYFLREDTVERKVYLREQWPLITNEVLMYNFNLEVGDTLDFGDTSEVKIVTSIDSVLMNTKWHKRMHITPEYAPVENYVDLIEGIGSTFGLNQGVEFPFEESMRLLCFSNDDSLYINFYVDEIPISVDSAEICDFLPSNVSIDGLQQQLNFDVYPNPVGQIMHIDLHASLVGVNDILLFNSIGELSKHLLHIDSASLEINVSDLLPGMYVLVVRGINTAPVITTVIIQ